MTRSHASGYPRTFSFGPCLNDCGLPSALTTPCARPKLKERSLSAGHGVAKSFRDTPQPADVLPVGGGTQGRLLHQATRIGSTPADAATVLTLFIFLLFAIPSRLVVAPLGGAGSPAQLVGMAALVWWSGTQLLFPRRTRQGARFIRPALLLFVVAVLASYVVATLRPISAIELRAADRGLLTLAAWLGIILVAADGVPSRARLETFLRRLVVAGGIIALLGLIQFQTGKTVVDAIQIPGLSVNSDLTNVLARDGFARAAGTALHPIEYGIVLMTILPLAIHFALFDRSRSLVRRWWAVVALALAAATSISRSVLVCGIVVLAFLIPTWPTALRRRTYVALVCLVGIMFVAIPGMLGTWIRLFSGIGSDSSALSRTDSYAIAFDFIARYPFFGRGLFTFLPEYRILDNQYLLMLIETGIVGLLAFSTLVLSALIATQKVRRRTSDREVGDLAQALGAAVAASAASLTLFDGLSFPQMASTLMLMLGAAVALYRLTGQRLDQQAGAT